MDPTTPRTRVAFALATAAIVVRSVVPGVRPAGRGDVEPASTAQPALQAGAERIADRVGVDRVTVHVWDAPAPNLFAVGDPDRAHVVVSTTAVDTLTEAELLGCIAHELGHARHRHAHLLCTAALAGLVAVTAASVTAGRRRGRVASALTGLSTTVGCGVVLFALARGTERTADRSAIAADRGRDLAGALVTVHSGESADDTNPAAYDPSPRGPLERLLATHPPVDERLASLTGVER